MKRFNKLPFSELLKQADLKVTKPRLAILDTLNNAVAPLSAKDVYQKLGSRYQIDQATIYRNLGNLVKNKLIRQVNFQHDHNHYELAESHHHHAICQSCGKVVDISKCDITTLEKQVKTVSGFANINQHALEFFGLCKKCAKK